MTPLPSSTAALLGWLADRVDTIRLMPQAPAVLTEFEQLRDDIAAVVDLPPAMVLLGPCEGCEAPMYAAQEAVRHACTTAGCVWTYDVARRKDALLVKARRHTFTATVLSTALTAYGYTVTEHRISVWAGRGRLARIGTDVRGRPTYRLGDALDLLTKATQ